MSSTCPRTVACPQANDATPSISAPRAHFPTMFMVRMNISEQHPHHKVDLPGVLFSRVYFEGANLPVLQRKQQVGARPVDSVKQVARISGQTWVQVVLTVSRALPIAEIAQFGGESIIHAKAGVELKLGLRLEFELRPPADNVQASYSGGADLRRSAEDHTPVTRSPEATQSAPSIKFSLQPEQRSQGNRPIRCPCPTV